MFWKCITYLFIFDWKIRSFIEKGEKRHSNRNRFLGIQGVYNKTRKITIQNYINLKNPIRRYGKTTQSSHPIKKRQKENALQLNGRTLIHFKSLVIPSLHIFHIIQRGITPQVDANLCRSIPPCQPANNSTTGLGITHEIPNKLSTNDHKLKA